MARTISALEAVSTIGQLIDLVAATKEAVIVEEVGEPKAVLISPEDFRRIPPAEDDPWAVIDRIRARMPDRDPDEVLREVTEIVEEVRQEHYEREQRDRWSESSLTRTRLSAASSSGAGYY